jgi:hypothetical protein
MKCRLSWWLLVVGASLILGGCGWQTFARCTSANPNGIGPTGAHIPAADRAFPAAENRRPGTAGWRICDAGSSGRIEGYADRVSVLPGRSFRLYVSTTAPRFRVQAFRMGWYGGRQGRQVWESGWVAGRAQAPARLIAATRTVTTGWRPSLTVGTAGWPAGAYLLRLDSSDGPEGYVPLTVRSRSVAGKVVLLEGVTTWQAYNSWGGYDLYHGPRGFDDRSYAVSFDRPYDLTGAALFLYFDQPPVALAESTGVPLAYETDVDLDEHPGLLAGARAVISLGHDEYYSPAMRMAVLRARHAGTNFAFLGANAMYRHIRFAASALGPDRIQIAYKVARRDPAYRHDDAASTQNWRDPPDPRPESVMTGVFYECNPVNYPYVVTTPGSWIFAGTGVRRGTSIPGLVGPEYDRINPAVPFLRPLQILAHSPVTCLGHHSFADSAYYTVRGGAGVFASGTMRWVCAMRGPVCGHGVGIAAQRFVDRATENLLHGFAAGPAGRRHPALDNLADVRPSPGTPFEAFGVHG